MLVGRLRRDAAVAALLLLCLPVPAQGQDAVAELRREVEALRAENDALRQQLRRQRRGVSTLSRETAGENSEFSVLSRWDTFSSAPEKTTEGEDSPASLDDLEGLMAEAARADTLFGIGADPLVRKYLEHLLSRRRGSLPGIYSRYEVAEAAFREEFIRRGVPEELTFIAIIESAMNPRAVSPKGAAGIWQLMEGTARDHGLHVNYAEDERFDTGKATRVAAEVLMRNYRNFGRWDLAVAAYNCGGGTVRTAMRKSSGKTYIEIRDYLPRETREYVPAVVAAMVVGKHRGEL